LGLRHTSQVLHLELQRKLTLTTMLKGSTWGQPKRRKVQYKGNLGSRLNIGFQSLIRKILQYGNTTDTMSAFCSKYGIIMHFMLVIGSLNYDSHSC
jgi:hypothetical protein